MHKPIDRHLVQSNGMFETADEESRELIMEIVACFHFRNGFKNEDGSRGEIDISPKQLRDILAYMLKHDS